LLDVLIFSATDMKDTPRILVVHLIGSL